MYSIMLYLHKHPCHQLYWSDSAGHRGYNHCLTLEGAISLFSVTKSQRPSGKNKKRLYLMHCEMSKLRPTPIINFFLNIDGAMHSVE